MGENSFDHGLDHLTPAGKNFFNADTYVGNWYEETVRNTLNREDFLMKRECEDLAVQKTQKMVNILLKPVELPPNIVPFVRFGDTIQLISPGPDCKTALEKYPFKRNYCKLAHLALSTSVPAHAVEQYAPYLSTDSIISASPHLYPVVRNSFIIEKPDCPNDTSPLNYGDVFRLRTMPTQHFTLYLFSSPGIRLHSLSSQSGKTIVRLSDMKTSDTLWRAVPLDPALQLEMPLGVQVPLKNRLMIKHACSGNNLAVETNFPIATHFGTEYEVTLDTKRDTLKRITFENHWYFDTERGWKKPQDKEFVEQAKYSAAINVHSHDEKATEEKVEDHRDQNCESQNQPAMNYPSESECTQQNALVKTVEAGDTPPYAPLTGPQPHAYSYRLSKEQEFFPNKKWNCGETGCHKW